MSLFAPSSAPVSYTLAANGVMRLTAPMAAQVWTNISGLGSAADASLFAGANVATPYGSATTLVVGTSNTSVHDATSVALLRFNLTAPATAAAANIALLELSVAAAPSTTASVLAVIGLATSVGGAWVESSVTWASAAFAVNASMSGSITNILSNFVNLGNAAAVRGFCDG